MSITRLLMTMAMACAALWPAAAPSAPEAPAKAQAPAGKKKPLTPEQQRARAEKARQRAAGLVRLAARFHVGPGSTVADIGAGQGQDSWVWAEIVGPKGTLFAEEVTQKQVDALKAEAANRKLSQVRPVLGKNDDPGLPAGQVDLAYMRLAYHHFSEPRPMLRGIWRALKPGGYLVIVDRNRGTLQEWVPYEMRRDKHFWTAETTVVREAREEGFLFVACAEDCCEIPEPFVLVFQRPEEQAEPGRDPDPFLPLDVKRAADALIPSGAHFKHPMFIALGEGRKLIAPILRRSSGRGQEVVLEEWATQKDERPPLPAGVALPSVLTKDGDPHLDGTPIDAVFFLDSYHLMFHGPTLLAKLHERLVPGGRVFIMDRQSPEPLLRREASHRRRIEPEVVKREMEAAGFAFRAELARPSADRFLLGFEKR